MVFYHDFFIYHIENRIVMFQVFLHGGNILCIPDAFLLRMVWGRGRLHQRRSRLLPPGGAVQTRGRTNSEV